MASCTASIVMVFIITSFNILAPCVGQICITGDYLRSDELNGVYAYYNYDTTLNGQRYYNSDLGMYLYPLIYLDTYYEWLIDADYTNSEAVAYARISPTPSPTYFFDIDDVSGQWKVASNSVWYSQTAMRVGWCRTSTTTTTTTTTNVCSVPSNLG
eukprot:1091542_1